MDREHFFSAYFDEELSTEQLQELSAWMKQSPDHVRLFAERSAMESHLYDLLGEKEAAAAASKLWPPEEPDEVMVEAYPAIRPKESAACAELEEMTLAPVSAEVVHVPSQRRPWYWIGRLLAAAAVILCLVGGGIWYWLASRPVDSIISSVNAQWENGNGAPVGSSLGTRPQTLLAGIVELKLRNGANVVVEAPAQFTLISPSRVRLDRGRVSALVPAAARGFTVQVVGGEFVDMGTEFAVDVRLNQPTYAQVFRGLVKANLFGPSNELVASQNLSASQAVELRQGAGIVAVAASRSPEFILPGEVNEHSVAAPPVAVQSNSASTASTSFIRSNYASSKVAVEPNSASTASLPMTPDIQYVGSFGDIDDAREATHWRTPGVKKSMDVTGSNVYGSSLGCVDWTRNSMGEQVPGSSKFGWACIDAGRQFIKDSYCTVDDVKDATTGVHAGIAVDYFKFELTGTAADYAGKTVRIGIMEDCLGPAEQANDRFKGLRVICTSRPNPSQSAVQPVRGGAPGSGTPEFYVFDLKNVQPGDRFDIRPSRDVGGISGIDPEGGHSYIGPVFWDIAKNSEARK